MRSNEFNREQKGNPLANLRSKKIKKMCEKNCPPLTLAALINVHLNP